MSMPIYASSNETNVQTTDRVPNDPIDISSTELSYYVYDENGSCIIFKDDIVKY